jgi:hypothetical protein
MNKWLYLSLAVVALLVLGISFPVLAQPIVPCTGAAEYGQVKVAQVPIPWQFWATVTNATTGVTTAIDRIRISPTWLNPPVGQPAGQGTVFVRRQVARSPVAIPLEQLVWGPDGPVPEPFPGGKLEWQLVDTLPMPVEEGKDLELPIELASWEGAVLVAYEVMNDALGEGPPVLHSINEAVLEGDSPKAIVQVMVNFDVQNNTGGEVTNFELDFLGIDFSCRDIPWALGFVKGTGELWGANEDSPLVVRPINGGTEVKWVQRDRALRNSEWLHCGLMFRLGDLVDGDVGGVGATVQGYWTIIVPPSHPVPTVSQWGAIGMTIALAGCIVWMLRKRGIRLNVPRR